MGGVDALIEWGTSNPSDFYRLYARLIPQQLDADVQVRDVRELSTEELLRMIQTTPEGE